jgi:hypothetical protein
MVNGNNNVKEWTGVHSSLVVSLHKVNNMLGKQITFGQLIANTSILHHYFVSYFTVIH